MVLVIAQAQERKQESDFHSLGVLRTVYMHDLYPRVRESEKWGHEFKISLSNFVPLSFVLHHVAPVYIYLQIQ